MTTVLWIIAAIVIVNILLVTFWYFFREKEEPSVEPVEKPSEPANEPQEPEKPSEPVEPDTPSEPEPTPEPETPVEPSEPEQPTEPETPEPEYFEELVDYFSEIVQIPSNGLVHKKLKEIYEKCLSQYHLSNPDFLRKENFPVPWNYWTEQDKEGGIYEGFLKMCAWCFCECLSELVPDKRDILCKSAYEYFGAGEESTYGYCFDEDPNVARMVAAAIYAVTRDASIIPELRKEVGGKMVTYKNDVSELYIDTTKFMPTAPPPYLSQYKNRPKGVPADASVTEDIDMQIHNYISQYYSLDTKDKDKRQATIQAISNKEYKKPHLFGRPRTVNDSKFGTMTFNPVFGKHNLGIEIPDNGDIANFVYEFGKICSATRITLLNQEYGRRRPGEGEQDGKANSDSKQRVLVNYAIEEGDGHTTGYYDMNGNYVDNNGVSIGDYEAYFQNQVYANSYPSGHSAYIEGVGLMLMMVMPDKADAILKATNAFAISRCICRYHWMSDTIHGRVIGSTMVPVLAATTNTNFDNLLNKAKEEYQRILSGDVTPEPTPDPTEKVNTSLAYAIGGYGSCHVDAGEKQMVHRCTKQCTKERHPSITVNQRVTFTIEGGGVTDDNGKTSGVWEANTPYGIKCPAVTEDKYAYITMRNENGVKVLEYRCSKDGTHDDGVCTY